ncbi:MAG: phosphoglucosamine mutase [Coriobacteriales bacterium]|nr:phosphoglucosamine mutase [Coriobacteriales bacterium]
MARLFGTDGVRGVAGEELSYELAVALGRAAVRKLGGRIVIGRDTRVSGPMLEEGLRAGIAAEGASAPALLGVIPTPGLAWYTGEEGFDCGIMITASHNAPEYNGIKFFSSKGFKLPDEVEDEMQAVVEELLGQPVGQPPAGQLVEDAVERFVAHDIAPLQEEGLSLAGMHIALDCAHGAACTSTPLALERLGAQVTAINTEPDGSIINVECGSTHLGPVTELMRACGADIALAHDGDADRLLAVAPGGTVCDGDFILAICAKDMQERGTLSTNTVVGTVMANLGFMQAMEREGIGVVATKVGDRYVLESMLELGARIGGEQSGHVIDLSRNTTGDGLATALMLLGCVARSGKSLGELMGIMRKLPQCLVNVRVRDKALYAADEQIAAVQAEVEAELEGNGRLLVRPSGTEPLIRVMIEAQTQEQAERLAHRLADLVQARIGA